MRRIISLELEAYRMSHPMMGDSLAGEPWGFFILKTGLRVISSGYSNNDFGDLGLWEHVSASHPDKMPTWQEMADLKSLFWAEDECVIQFHPPKDEYVNAHPYTLHLWKPPYETPRPPTETMV